MSFSAWVGGNADGELVLLLHGFPQSRHSWRLQLPALIEAGYRVIAPDQRGYSAGARPDPSDLSNYRFENLVTDALDIVAATGSPDRRFHLVGHDWGGQVSWGVASAHPERLASLSVLSRPHPQAFLRALKDPDGEQKSRSKHHRSFLSSDTASLLLADDASRLRQMLLGSGVPSETVDDYVSILGDPQALEAALAWYRASPNLDVPIGLISVPTLYIWGDADQTVGRAAAEATSDYLRASCQFAVLPGVGHFASDQAPEQVNQLLLHHLAAHRC